MALDDDLNYVDILSIKTKSRAFRFEIINYHMRIAMVHVGTNTFCPFSKYTYKVSS